MDPDAGNIASSLSGKFASFALLDLETSGLPVFNNNKTAITELCIYGFSADISNESLETEPSSTTEKAHPVPSTPRVLHKLTLLLNPMRMIHPESERITGLNNYILEPESNFDDNAANTVIGFLQHLQQPVCLVAHNGWGFDFPIVKQAFEKLQKNLPNDMVCVDSLRAFLEIDKKRAIFSANDELNCKVAPTKLVVDQPITIPLNDSLIKDGGKGTAMIVSLTDDIKEDEFTLLEDALSENSQFNWRTFNESTPKRAPRPPHSVSGPYIKRKLLVESDLKNSLQEEAVTPEKEPSAKKPAIDEESSTPTKEFKSRRSLKFDENASPVIKKYPPRGVYKLQNMFERIFGKVSLNAHHAEADVRMLMKLLLHYGADFIAYAEQHAKPLSEVPRLGRY